MLIAHFSDPHLCHDGALYNGLVDSNAMFEQAIATLNRLMPVPDVVIIGGDLVDNGLPEEYATVHRAISKVRQPVFAIPGNHDSREAFRACFRDRGFATETGPLHFDFNGDTPIRILGLDVTVPRRHEGAFTEKTGAWLEHRLAQDPGKPTVVLMHQPPIDTGLRCIDQYRCGGAQRLEKIIARHENVVQVLCGHVHRFIQARFGGTTLLTAPSTTTAIALDLDSDAEGTSYVEPPAFLLHQWRDGTGLVTHWVPVGTFRGPLPFF